MHNIPYTIDLLSYKYLIIWSLLVLFSMHYSYQDNKWEEYMVQNIEFLCPIIVIDAITLTIVWSNDWTISRVSGGKEYAMEIQWYCYKYFCVIWSTINYYQWIYHNFNIMFSSTQHVKVNIFVHKVSISYQCANKRKQIFCTTNR